MKRVFISFSMFCLVFIVSCGPKQSSPTDMVNIPATASEGVNKSDLPDMKFDETVFDFGTITQGEKVTHDFKFENNGSKELIISSAYADCGCTTSQVPRQPIPPGESNSIRVTFDSDKKTGMVTKEISVLTNCIPNKKVIKIKANIFVPQSKNSN